jgi:hypothetical protein
MLLAASRAVCRQRVLLLRYICIDVDKDNTDTATSTRLEKCNRLILPYGSEIYKQSTTSLVKLLDWIGRSGMGINVEQSATFFTRLTFVDGQAVNVIWNELFGEIMNNGKPRLTVSDKTFLEVHNLQRQTGANQGDDLGRAETAFDACTT